jgi:hypothetical protein
MALTCTKASGRGRYRTADRWCVKGQDSVNYCSIASNTCRSVRCLVQPASSCTALCVPVLGHWRDTDGRVFGVHRVVRSVSLAPPPRLAALRIGSRWRRPLRSRSAGFAKLELRGLEPPLFPPKTACEKPFCRLRRCYASCPCPGHMHRRVTRRNGAGARRTMVAGL